MSKRYSGKSFKDSSVMKKAKLTLKEKRKLKKEITKLFGNEAYISTGELNKKYIADQIFSDNSKRTLSKPRRNRLHRYRSPTLQR